MRAIVALLVLVIIAAAYLVADTVVRDRTQTAIAQRIEANEPGTTAGVQISSFPFTGRLAATGQVERLQAEVTGLDVKGVAVQSVDLDVHDLAVDRSQLLHGTVLLRSIRTATVVATITQSAVDSHVGLPITFGAGTVGLSGVQLPATVSIADDRLQVAIKGLSTVSLPLIPPSLLPCAASGSVTPGALVLTCTTSTIPPALVKAVAGG